MVHAFIMVKAATGDAGGLSERLAGIDHVSVASVVAGSKPTGKPTIPANWSRVRI